jgi:hypothetical protein
MEKLREVDDTIDELRIVVAIGRSCGDRSIHVEDENEHLSTPFMLGRDEKEQIPIIFRSNTIFEMVPGWSESKII